MPLPDTAAAGDSGHVADHNAIVAEMAALPGTYVARVLPSEAITAAQASAGTEAHATVFTGDFSKTLGSGKLTLSGSALPSPATGYKYTPEATSHYVVLVNSTGHNESLAGNDGRTSATAYRTMVWHTGQGDAVAYNAYVDVSGTKPGATHWLASPAGVILNGQVELRAAHTYGNPLELNINDNGFDAAGIGPVINLTRSNGAAAFGDVWMGMRVQSKGAVDVDVGYSLSGKFKRGIDLTQPVYSADLAAVTIKADDRIYLASTTAALNGMNWYATTPGTEWLDSPAAGGIELVSKGKRSLHVTATSAASINYVQLNAADTAGSPQLFTAGTDTNIGLLLATKGTSGFNFRTGGTGGPTQFFIYDTAGATRFVRVTGHPTNPILDTSAGDLNIVPATGFILNSGTQILRTRRTGWAVATGTKSRATFDTTVVTLPALAAVVGALIDDLHGTAGHGLIGT